MAPAENSISTVSNEQPTLTTPGGTADKERQASSPINKIKNIFGLGKVKHNEAKEEQPALDGGVTTSLADSRPTEASDNNEMPRPSASTPPVAVSPQHPYLHSASPLRNLRSPSPGPGTPSPASSQIFERNVQEDLVAVHDQGPIPNHIATENHIPPVLDASSEAIMHDTFDPDQVQIVMHAGHLPASTVVAAATAPQETTQPNSSSTATYSEELSPPFLDAASTTDFSGPAIETSHILRRDPARRGVVDATADVRRLSFVSFADVVHSENHGISQSQQLHPHGESAISPSLSTRSSSPLRGAPINASEHTTGNPLQFSSRPHPQARARSRSRSQLGSRVTSQPGSPPAQSNLGIDSGIGSAGSSNNATSSASPSLTSNLTDKLSHPGIASSEVTIETMRQALRKTNSAEFTGGLRSMSPGRSRSRPPTVSTAAVSSPATVVDPKGISGESSSLSKTQEGTTMAPPS